ncbi:M48 metallopeptidase family protein [Neomoorella carbonis]|uniref:M48 metallopeptidase family protein n=1 Tax=Neomoorella carbonis TaxID=3062783 RepID=UPI00324F216E
MSLGLDDYLVWEQGGAIYEGAFTLATLDKLEEVIPEAVFRAEVATWAKRIGVEPKEIHIRAMKRKWASCSSKGRLTFDPELLKQPAAFRAEVIVHELLHLKISNHGPLFKAMGKAYLAKYGVGC